MKFLKQLVLVSVMMLVAGATQCAAGVGNPDVRNIGFVYQGTALWKVWQERLFWSIWIDRSRKIIDNSEYDYIPPLIDFQSKKFLQGALWGAIGTGVLGGILAYVSAQQTQQLFDGVKKVTTRLALDDQTKGTIATAIENVASKSSGASAIKNGLSKVAGVAAAGTAALSGIPAIFFGSKAFAFGCALSSAITAAILCAVAK
jgi:hypothetical protein